MAVNITKVNYYYATVRDQPGEAYKIFSFLQDLGINLQAFTAVPVGPNSTQLAIFPENEDKFVAEAKKAAMVIDGPHHALLVQGDDQLGALVEIHEQLFKANINVYAANGVTDGRGGYGYLVYVKPDDFERALETLGL